MGLLIGFGRGFGVEFRWWIVVASMWWAMGCGGTVGLGLSLVGLLGGSGGLACVVDGGSVGFFFFFFWVLINCVDGGSIRFFFLFCVGFFFF